jgi:pimeloyl-ACP methyl ester carboxylesterase
MVLVDATHPDIFDRLPKIKRATEEWCRSFERKEYKMFFGISRLQASCGATYHDFPDMRRAIECRESYLRETRAECVSVLGESADQVRATGPLGTLPLVVISEDPNRNSKEFLSAFEQSQAELEELSTNSERIIAAKSGHQIQLERPDVVIQAIQNVVKRSKSSR